MSAKVIFSLPLIYLVSVGIGYVLGMLCWTYRANTKSDYEFGDNLKGISEEENRREL